MKISLGGGAKTKTINLFGSLNQADIPGLRAEILDVKKFDAIFLNLSNLDSVGTPFINLLIDLNKRDPALSKRIKLMNPGHYVLDILKMTHMDRIYELIYHHVLDELFVQLENIEESAA